VASPPEARVPEVSFLEFRDRAGLDRRRVPIEGTVETTYRCNLNCVHCYVNEPAESREERERELSLERLKGLVDEIVAEGTLFVLFTGGEVLVRPDFPELYLYARSKGLLVTIFTNGTMITDRIADLFAEHPPDKVEISLYGMTKETYDRVTRVPGSFEKCLAGIRRLVERGVPTTLKTMALTWNHHEIEEMEAYAKSLGLVFRFDSSLNPRVDCGANRNSELQLDPERALELDLGSPERMEGFREFCERFTRPDADYGAERSTPAAPARARSPWIPTGGCRCASSRGRASTTSRAGASPTAGTGCSRGCASGPGRRTRSAESAA
jgi:MoaA/NifB/PqqE/SkfB family radical SAM enzyme